MSDATTHRLFRALWEVGLDRMHLSIHEMLTDILEVIQVAQGVKPAHLAGQGEGAGWRMDEFERIAAAAGLHGLRTTPMAVPAARWAGVSTEFPLLTEALRAGGVAPLESEQARRVLWLYRCPGLAAAIGRLVAGDSARVPEVLGYPRCCAEHEARSESRFVRALMRLYEEQHGTRGEAAVLEAMASGLTVRPAPEASVELESVWGTRLVFPYLGYTACPRCLAWPKVSPSGHLNRRSRALAFRLEEGFAVALWRRALGEAALATRGSFQALDPKPDDPCPCGSDLSYAACCAQRSEAMPRFR